MAAPASSNARFKMIGNMAFLAGLAWFAFNVHAIVTDYLYMFSLSWYPFLVLLVPLLYPAARRVASVDKSMLVSCCSLAVTLCAGMILEGLPLGSLTIMVDIARLGSFGSFLALSCAYFESQSLPITRAVNELAQNKNKKNHSSLVIGGTMLLSAACFAAGGTEIHPGHVLSVSCILVSALMVREARATMQPGAEHVLRSSVNLRQAFTPRSLKAGFILLGHVMKSIFLAFLVAFLGGTILPRTGPFAGTMIDAATPRFLLAACLSTVAGLVLYLDPGNARRHAGAITNHETRETRHFIIRALAQACLCITIGVALFVPVPALNMAAAMLVVPAFCVVQFTRDQASVRNDWDALSIQRTWMGVITSLILGAGSTILVLLLRVGMIAEMAMISCVALGCASIIDMGIRVVVRKSQGAA
jgi:hypothetical protein